MSLFTAEVLDIQRRRGVVRPHTKDVSWLDRSETLAGLQDR